MRQLKILSAALAILITSFVGGLANAIPATTVQSAVLTKKPLSAAKNPLSKKFIAEQRANQQFSTRGFSASGPGVGTSSDNCELTPDSEECGGTVVGGFWEVPYFDSISSSFDTATVELERVEVNGRSICSGSVSTSYGTSFSICGALIFTDPPFMGMNTIDFGGIADLIGKFLDSYTPEPPKKLVKCIYDQEVASGHPGMTLTRDARDGYSYAELTFMRIYGGALPGIESGLLNPMFVDVKYPDGHVFTFIVLKNSDDAGVELISPRLNEKIASGENKCA